MTSPTLCVVVPNYNYARYIGEAVSSLLKQSHPPAQIILTDDGSTDDSRQVIDSLRGSWGGRVRVEFFPHRGLVPTLNAVLPSVTTKYITVLAADDRWRPELARTAVESLDASPSATLWHCQWVDIDAAGKVGSEADGDPRIPAAGDSLEGLLLGRCVVKGAYALPTGIVREIGGFDERYPNEDWSLFLRAAAKGPFVFCDTPLLERRVHGANWSTRVWKEAKDPTRYSAPELMRDLSPTEDVYQRALAFHLASPVRSAFHAGQLKQGGRLATRLLKQYPSLLPALGVATAKGLAGALWRAGPKRVIPNSIQERLKALVLGSRRR